MDNKDEVLLTSLLFVSLYLCNTNRVPNAIDMCKEVLFLLQRKTLGNMDEKCVKSFENIHSHAIGCGIRPILTSRQTFERKVELITTCILAELYKGERKHNEAKGLDLKALKVAENIGDSKITAKCSGHLEHCKKALVIAGKIGDRKIEATCYGLLGSIFESLGEYVKATEHYVKALAFAEKIGDRKTEAKCYVNQVSILRGLGKYAKAKEHSEKALAIAEKISDMETGA